MSRETMEWLRSNIRIGYTGADGPAWWARSGEYMTDGTHFDGPVPVEEVERLLSVEFVEGSVISEYTAPVLEKDGTPAVDLTEVDGEPQFIPRAEVRVTRDDSRKTIITPDTGDILGIFKTDYQVHGYKKWTADQVAAILDTSRGELGVKSVGLLRKRGVAFLQAQLAGTGLEVGGFAFAPYILAATSVDGTLSSTYATGITAAVCDNTLLAALLAALTKFKVRHSKNSAGKLADVRNALSLVYQTADEFIASAGRLQAVDVTEKDFTAWRNEMAPIPARNPKSSTGGAAYTNAVKIHDRYTNLWTYDAKVAPWAGTAFGVLQLDNTYRTWDRTVSGNAGAGGGRMERNMLNMVKGITAQEDNAALDALARVMGERLTGALA